MNAQTQSAVTPARLLQPAAAIAIIVGIVIGAGIFKTPSMVAGVTGDAGWMLSVWVIGALVSVAGALCYAELSAKHPHAGGDYHFLELAYGRRLSFLYAWAKATVINTGSIALLAFVFGEYMTRVIDLGPASTAIWAIGIVIVMTVLNLIGLQASSRVQLILTVLEVLGLVAVVIAGFMVTAPAEATPTFFEKSPPLGLAGLALVFVLLTFGGWNEAAYISAEVRGGPRRIVGVIILSLLLITGIYILINLALLHALGLKGLASAKAPAAEVMELAFGVWGEKAIGLFVAFAALTSINATMIVGARSNFAVGLSWSSLRFMGRWNVDSGTPAVALLVQGAIALALVIFGTQQRDGFGAMVEFTAPVFWSFLFLVGVAVFLLHHRPFQGERFDVPLYPITPALFIASCAYLAYSSITYAASKNAVHISLGVMAVGVLALVLLELAERRAKRVAVS